MKKRGILLILTLLLCATLANAYFYEYKRGDILEDRKTISYKLGYLAGYDDASNEKPRNPYMIYDPAQTSKIYSLQTSITEQIALEDLYPDDFIRGYRIGFLDFSRQRQRYRSTQKLYGIERLYSTPDIVNYRHQADRTQVDVGVQYISKDSVYEFGKEQGIKDFQENPKSPQPYKIYDKTSEVSKHPLTQVATNLLYKTSYYKGYRDGFGISPDAPTKDVAEHLIFTNSYQLGYEDGNRDKLLNKNPNPYEIFAISSPFLKDPYTLRKFLGSIDKINYMNGYREGYKGEQVKKKAEFRVELNSYELGYTLGYQDKLADKEENHVWIYDLNNKAFGDKTKDILKNIKYKSYSLGYSEGYNS
ncbi:hypothetical protein HN419_06730 [Candidatus Woesearchaeota archaeon]|jgi:hypothetical protein|nr:hypothetical protein [Candidatus Woesearchaeota archaeon]MBT3538190.1 hypothetical protein [Candidatus Woesearchaeota archaeon]MBT4697451.1 hypothetical protein [Candidatus Woesearchaeota archaeon]MBT4716617.1 hypothetical protein [Candidatus Woesearchaeota archaeon]MBT7105859.1 hypothetical protein [Candidatus Woesearchaeota archaeon]